MTANRRRVLIVEDEESLLKLETLILTSNGFDVTGCADGTSAIEEFARNRPDVVILDIMLPDIDGFEVCRRIKSLTGADTVPVIMLTAKKNISDVERGVQAGASAYMTKPFKSTQLIRTIEDVLIQAGSGS